MPSHAMSNHCALRAPTVFLVRIKTIRTKNTVMDKSNSGLELVLYKIADCVRMCFSSARNRRFARTDRRPRKSGRRSSSYLDTFWGLSPTSHCALRAPTVFLVRIKTIRTKNTVMDKSNSGLELVLYKIADCVRMCFSSARNRRSARTGRRPRKSGRRSSSYLDTFWGLSPTSHCALRAPTVFSVRMKSASVRKIRLWIKATAGLGWFYATSQFCNSRGGAVQRGSYSSEQPKEAAKMRD
jgi:hypothetical protein